MKIKINKKLLERTRGRGISHKDLRFAIETNRYLLLLKHELHCNGFVDRGISGSYEIELYCLGEYAERYMYGDESTYNQDLKILMNGKKNKFPNGFDSWVETHHHVVSIIERSFDREESAIYKHYEEKGTGGMYELGKELTNRFEREFKDVEWGVDESVEDYLDKLDKFIKRELPKIIKY